VTNRTAATRYARALLDVALKEQADLSAIEAQLSALAALFQNNEELRRVLASPAVPLPNKRAIVADIIRLADVNPILGKTVAMLAERDRLLIVPDVADVFSQRMLERRNIVRAVVTTAQPLAGDRLDAIQRGLTAATGRTVDLAARVDPSILGGMVARVGSTVFDASVTNHLQRIRQRLDASI
jgi:F-type H+-transporting ATPase subunit delta